MHATNAETTKQPVLTRKNPAADEVHARAEALVESGKLSQFEALMEVLEGDDELRRRYFAAELQMRQWRRQNRNRR